MTVRRERLRILQVVTLSERGGAQRHVADLTRALLAREHEVHVASSPGDYLLPLVQGAGAVVHVHPSLRRDIRPIADLMALFHLIGTIRRVRPDIVHAHSSKAGLLARVAARLCRAPSLYTAHGLVFLEPLSRLRRAVYLAMERIGGRCGDRIIAVSERDADAARRFRLAPPSDVVVVPNGYQAVRAPTPPPATPPFRFAVVANPYPTKGLDVLLAALRDPRLATIPIDVAIAGDGPDRMRLENEGDGLPVTFLGRVEDVDGLLTRSHALVMPSRKEGWPYAVLEAMAAGRPAIVTDVGGMAGQIGGHTGGWVVPPDDAEELAGAMAAAAADPNEAARRGDAAYRRLVERLGVDEMVDKIEAEYRAVVGRRRRGNTVQPDLERPSLVLLSPSPSRGMSHYVHALAHALAPHADTFVLDGSDGLGLGATWSRLRSLVRGRRAYVINTSPHWSVPLLVQAPGVRGAHILHDPILHAASRRTRSLHRLYYRLLTHRLRVVVLHAATFKNDLDSLNLRVQEVVVVPHGFVPERMRSDDPYDPSGPLVLIGRLLPYKGYDVLVEALSLLHTRGIDPHVIVGGEGVSGDMARPALAELEIRPGLLSDAEFADLIRRCAAVLLPYRVSSQSGVLATAFSAGRPVIASAVGSFPEYIEDGVNGLLIPPGDPMALADAIVSLREDPRSAGDMARAARATWETKLSPDRCARRIIDALSRLDRPGRGSSPDG